ncbi:MAG: hypothetical protein JWM98_307, partial [Thermoleophilia bacterium]|nr:hypothetical protein [Thermoleophilia bacterium]
MMNPTDIPFEKPDADAARAIRAATPAPDDAATERIAARIQRGLEAPARSTRPAAPTRRRRPSWQPALAAGVLVAAVAVAALAPSHDEGSRGVGPRLAAAAVLRHAGDTAYDHARELGPLADGEYQYVESSSTVPELGERFVDRRWISADGTTHVVMLKGSLLPEGTKYWVPAATCMSRADLSQTPLSLTPRPTVAVGSAPPACWKDESFALELTDARGPIVAAPPAGAAVAIHDDLGPIGSAPELTFGENVVERSTPSRVPPGAPMPAPNADGATGAAVAVEVTGPTAESPLVLTPATSWVQVTSRLREQDAYDIGPDHPAIPSPMRGENDWSRLFTNADVRALPDDADAMLAELQARVAKGRAAQGRAVHAGLPAAEPEDPARAVADLAAQLLGEAPISPAARRAVFGALALLGASGDATVERGVDLPGGGSAMRVTLPLEQPKGYEDPSGKQYTYAILLDEETGDLRAT